jgi:hypothetical protein
MERTMSPIKGKTGETRYRRVGVPACRRIGVSRCGRLGEGEIAVRRLALLVEAGAKRDASPIRRYAHTPTRQPFTAPAVRPATIRYWKIMTRITSGMVTTMEAAIIDPQGCS